MLWYMRRARHDCVFKYTDVPKSSSTGGQPKKRKDENTVALFSNNDDQGKMTKVDGKYTSANPLDGLKYCIVRSDRAGVFAGWVKERSGEEVVVLNSRRIWKWDGAATLSELAIYGSTKPDQCKVPCIVPETLLTDVIEIIYCSKEAQQCIESIPVWSADGSK